MPGETVESDMAVSRAGLLPASASTAVTVLAFPSPFRPGTCHTLQVGSELTVEEIIDEVGFARSMPWDLAVQIGPYRIPRKAWAWTRPNPGTVVRIRAIPHGGQSGKGVLQIVLGIALIAAAAFLWWTGIGAQLAIPGTTLLSLAFSGAAFVAAGAYSLASPPPAVPFTGEIPSSESRAIAAARNEVRPFAPVPRVFGRYRVFPQYAAKPYTEVVGSDQFLRLLFTFGYGPLALSEIKIGETPIDQFQGVEFAIHPGYDDDDPLSIFTSGVDEEQLQIEIPTTGVWLTRTTALDAHEASVDLVYPQGLIAFDKDDGKPKRVTSPVTIEFREVGSGGAWTGIEPTAPLAPGISNPSPGEIVIDARVQGLLIRGVRWRFPSPGQYDVRISRGPSSVSPPNTVLDDCTWTTLRSIRPGTAPRVPNLCLLELRIRASDQLSGVIQDLSAIAESILPVWNGVDGWGPDNRDSANASLQVTRNPAWALAEMLRGGVNARPVADENIDHVSLAEWAVICDAEGWTLDAVVDFETTVAEICRDIAGSARASFNLVDGRYGVVVDVPKPEIVAQFSDRDTGSFQGSKIFTREVHALRVRFVSPEAGFQPDEVIVYADGFDEENAREFGELDLWGVTDPDRAYRDGRYHMAAGRLRPEIYAFDIDVAQLVMTRGDRILYSHDVMLVGLGSARIRQIFTIAGQVTAVRIDEDIDYDISINYTARIRNSTTGEYELHPMFVPFGPFGPLTDQIHFQTPIDPEDAPQVGDLVAWGEAGKETGDFLVHSITPNSDLGARIELVDYSPAIFEADQGPIPPWDPNITDPRPRIVRTPSRPTIHSVASDESVLIIESDGAFRPRIVVVASVVDGDTVQATSLQAQYRTSDPVGDWLSAPTVDAQTSRISIEGVDEGEAYDVRVRGVSELGRASDWVTVNGHVVVGTATPPPDVEGLRVEPGEILRWDYPSPPRDLAGFIVRHQAGSDTQWSTAIPAHDGLVSVSSFDLAGLPPGQRTILVKAIDSAGNESINPGVVVKDIGGLAIENIVEDEDFHAGGFPGTKTDCLVEGATGDLIASLEQDLFWGPPGGLFWGAPTDSFWGDSYKNMEYVDSWEPPSAALPGRLFLDLEVQGSSWAVYYRAQGDPLWRRWPGWIEPETGTTYEFRLTISGGTERGRVTKFVALIDKPDLEERIDDFVVSSSGNPRLPITLPFTVIKQVLLTLQDDGNGATTARVVDKDPVNGPEVHAFDSGGRQTALVDARVRGY